MTQSHWPSQLVLPLDWAHQEPEPLIGPSNADAFAWIAHPDQWPIPVSLLVGPRKSGRSLFGRHFARHSGGRLIDDAERRAEDELFHAWNQAREEERPLLIVSAAAPPEWRIELPDLRTRLMATPVARIGAPDEALLQRLVTEQLLRRGHGRADRVSAWLAPRMERSHVALMRIVDSLDMAALAAGTPLTLALAREWLGRQGVEGPPGLVPDPWQDEAWGAGNDPGERNECKAGLPFGAGGDDPSCHRAGGG